MFVISLVFNKPSIYLQEVCDKSYFLVKIAVTCSVPTVCHLLIWHGLTQKKIQQDAIQRDTVAIILKSIIGENWA